MWLGEVNTLETTLLNRGWVLLISLPFFSYVASPEMNFVLRRFHRTELSIGVATVSVIG